MADKPPAPPAPGTDPAPEGGKLAERVDGLEAEQKRQGGMLEQILSRLSGGTPAPRAPAAAEAPDIAQLVRDGIAELEAKKAADAEGEANRTAREEYAARIAALEERVPAEREDSAPGRLRAGVQRVFYGITEPSR
jgi:hypothetical protein